LQAIVRRTCTGRTAVNLSPSQFNADGSKIEVSAVVPEYLVRSVRRFSGEECNRTADFTQFFDSYYYNCFTYRAPASRVDSDDDDAYSNLAEGLENGWSAVVLSGSSMLDQNSDEIRMIPGTSRSLLTY